MVFLPKEHHVDLCHTHNAACGTDVIFQGNYHGLGHATNEGIEATYANVIRNAENRPHN